MLTMQSEWDGIIKKSILNPLAFSAIAGILTAWVPVLEAYLKSSGYIQMGTGVLIIKGNVLLTAKMEDGAHYPSYILPFIWNEFFTPINFLVAITY